MPANIQSIACEYVARCTARQCEERAMGNAALIYRCSLRMNPRLRQSTACEQIRANYRPGSDAVLRVLRQRDRLDASPCQLY